MNATLAALQADSLPVPLGPGPYKLPLARHNGTLNSDHVTTLSESLPELRTMLATAADEARLGLLEGGVPIGAALYGPDGELWGRGHNRRVQQGDPSAHAETDAFRHAGRRSSYRGSTMVTTLSPCWYCSGLVRQFGISRVLVGEATTFSGGHDWLATLGVDVVVLDDPECIRLMQSFILASPELWAEDIGE